MKYSFYLGMLAVVLCASACSSNSGSSGSSSSSSGSSGVTPPLFPPNTDWSEEIQRDLSQFSEEQLKLVFSGYAKQLYQGTSTPAVISSESIQKASSMVMGSKSLKIPPLDYALLTDNPSLLCGVSGSVESSELIKIGNTTTHLLEYDQCEYEEGIINGTGLVTIHQAGTLSNYGMNGIIYYNEALVTDQYGSWRLTGYHNTYADVSDGVLWQEESSHMLHQNADTDIAFLTDDTWSGFTTTFNHSQENHVIQAQLSDEGLFEIESEDGIVYTFKNNNNVLAILDFNYLLKVLVDSGASDSFDLGNYYIDLEDFISEDLSQNPLATLDEMRHPPMIENLSLSGTGSDSSQINTEDTIVMTFDYSDSDTAQEELTLNYSWLLSGETIPNQTETTLPAGIATDGSQVQGIIHISDGDFSFSVTSEPVDVWSE